MKTILHFTGSGVWVRISVAHAMYIHISEEGLQVRFRVWGLGFVEILRPQHVREYQGMSERIMSFPRLGLYMSP